MNILCVEDERIIARHIKVMLNKVMKESTFEFFHAEDIEDAESIISEKCIDLVLLDLNLNGKSGFSLLTRMVSESFDTVIISANVDQAIKAFEYGVIDFVGKPFTQERLSQAIVRVKESRTVGGGAKYLCIKKASQLVRIKVKDILYIKGAGGYSEVCMIDKTTYLHDKNLDKLLALLPENIIRIHKSYLVDIEQIQSLKTYPGSKYEVLLKNGSNLPVSRQRVKKLKLDLL